MILYKAIPLFQHRFFVVWGSSHKLLAYTKGIIYIYIDGYCQLGFGQVSYSYIG